MADERGTSMSNGFRGYEEEIAIGIVNGLQPTLRSLTSMMQDINTTLQNLNKNTEIDTRLRKEELRKKSSGSSKFGSIEKSDYSELIRQAEAIKKQVQSSLSRQRYKGSMGSTDDATVTRLASLESILTKLIKRVTQFQEQITEQDREYTELFGERDRLLQQQVAIEKEIRMLKHQANLTDPQGKNLELITDIGRREAELREIIDRRDTIQRRGVELEKQGARHIEDKFNEAKGDLLERIDYYTEILDNQREKMEQLNDAYDKVLGVSESAGRISEYVSNGLSKLESSYSGTYVEQYYERMNDIADNLQNAIDEYTEILNDDRKLTEQQKLATEQQLKAAKAQLELVKKATPMRDILTDAGKSIKQAGKDLIKSFSSSAIKALENRYLQSYLEGFQNVYNSIEQTRNSISARLKLGQGEYNELQESIYESLEKSGLSGSLSSSEVNEMIVSLAQAGITDLDTIEAMGLYAAQAKASGSALDLTNEETLQLVLSQLQEGLASGLTKQDALNQIGDMFEYLVSAEAQIQKEQGHEMALANGGMNQILNEIWKTGLAQGKSFEQIQNDISSGMFSKNVLYSMGIDDTTISSIIKDMSQGKLSDMPAFQQYLAQLGMNPDELGNLSYAEQTNIAYSALKEIIKDANATILPYLKDVYGLSADTLDLRRLQASEVITITPDDDFSQNVYSKQDEIAEALETGNYLSRTEQVKIEQQNKQFEKALKAEQYYEGDKIYSDQYNGIINAIDSVTNTIQDGLISMGSMLIQGGFKGSTSSPLSNGTGSGTGLQTFLTGGKGTVGGNIAMGVGAGVAVFSASEEIVKGVEQGLASEEIAANVFGDTGVWGGIGATVGAAFGGPFGAAVGGAIGSAVAPVFGKLSEMGAEWGTSGSVTNGFAESVSELESAASLLYESAAEQLDVVSEQEKSLDALDNLTNQEKANYLIKQGKLTEEQFKQCKSMDEILFIWDSMIKEQKAEIEKQKREAQNKQMASTYASSYAQQLTNLSQGIPYEPGNEINLIQSRLGKQGAVDLLNYVESYGGSTREAISSLGVDVQTEDYLVEYVKAIQGRKEEYEKQNYMFHNKWTGLAKQKNIPLSESDAILSMYITTYGEPSIKWSEDGIHPFINSEGLPDLEDNDGVYYNNKLKFKTGLTYVPSDDYPALLHKGERVLTQEEANAYNKFSSYAINTLANEYSSGGDVLSNISSQVFNTANYGISDVEEAITDQTKTVSTLLKEVLNAINNLALALSTGNGTQVNANILRMNSNVTQLMTL